MILRLHGLAVRSSERIPPRHRPRRRPTAAPCAMERRAYRHRDRSRHNGSSAPQL